MTPRALYALIVGFGSPLVLLVADWNAELPSPWPFFILAFAAVHLWIAHAEACPWCRRYDADRYRGRGVL